MKWFRHYSDAGEDEVLSALKDQFGMEGYGVWWTILETVTRQIHNNPKDFVEYSVKKWREITGVFTPKLNKILEFLCENSEESPKLLYEFCEKKGIKYLKVRIPKILEIADEYTKKRTTKTEKSGQTPDKLQTKSGETPEKIPLDKIRLDKKRINTSKQKQKIIFDFNNKKWENIEQDDITQWREAYPACDIELELKQMKEWLLSNPDKKKKNYRRFITNWLSRSQERGGTKKGGNYGKEPIPTAPYHVAD